MSKPANAIVQILLADATVSGIVADRIRRNEADELDALPYVVVEVESVQPSPTKDAVSSVDYPIVRVISYAESLETVDSLTEAVRTALDGKAAGTYGGIQVNLLRYQSETDFKEEIKNRKIYAVDQSYMMRVIR